MCMYHAYTRRCELLVKRYDAEKDATGIAAARPELDAAPSEQ